MKNYIFLNYNLKVDKIFSKSNKKFFFINSEKIYIIETNFDKNYLDDLVYLTNNLYYNNIKVNTFIKNKDNSYYCIRNNNYFLLLKENGIDEMTLGYLEKFQNISTNLKKYDLYNEWCKEIDTIEKELLEYNKEFMIIQKSVDYFIGLGENAIQLIGDIKEKNSNSIGHYLNYKIYETNCLNDPFTFINVNKMYDVSNYIKYVFYRNEIDYDEIEKIIKSSSIEDNIVLFACLLYPNVYLDLVKKILIEEEKEDKLLFIIKRINEYEKLLTIIKNDMNNVNSINLINWISD